ncbi:MAG TPA: heavy metal-binding domain-containing protein [Acidimicrobiia bacterium]|nr:heavy metal-binding domain-containing protein [Acidimicrobiia bacterium]
MFELIFYVVVPLLVLIVGAITGTIQERRHLASLDEREPAVADIAVTDLRGTPPGMIAVSGELVMGQVVLGSDRGKQVVAQLRSLIGGEVRSFQTILVRARREARLRMLEEARRIGADCVVNVRFETSEITNLAAEVLCYGTAIRTAR